MSDTTAPTDTGRRHAVLETALDVFARTGYRATSMDAVARAARISRPGLYFLFASKQALFREAAAHVLSQDLAAIERILGDAVVPVEQRVLEAFDRWAGRYVGGMVHDVPTVLEDNQDLVDDSVRRAPAVFETMLTAALTGHADDAPAVARALCSVSVGLKHQVRTRDAYRERLASAIGLLVR